MSEATAHGLAAVIDFNMNVLQVLILITLAGKWFMPAAGNQILELIDLAFEPVYRPLRRLTGQLGLSEDFNWPAILLLALLIPAHLILVAKLRGV